jgi:hypothetical protein
MKNIKLVMNAWDTSPATRGILKEFEKAINELIDVVNKQEEANNNEFAMLNTKINELKTQLNKKDNGIKKAITS